MKAQEREHGAAAEPWDWWNAQIAKRDFMAAEAALTTLEAARFDRSGWFIGGYYRFEVSQVITYWFLQAGDRLQELLAQYRARLEEGRISGDDPLVYGQQFEQALLAAAVGDGQEAQRLVRAWRCTAVEDQVELVNLRYHACRVLGMAAATVAAVECLREGLAEPSYFMPFVEPFLPYYDAIRDEPGFVELLVEIGSE